MRLAAARADAPTSLVDALNLGVVVLDRDGMLDALRAELPDIEQASAVEIAELRQKAMDSLNRLDVSAAAIARFVGDDPVGAKPDALTRKAWLRLSGLADDHAALRLAASRLTTSGEPLTVKTLRAAQESPDPKVMLLMAALQASAARIGQRLDELVVWSRRRRLGQSARAVPTQHGDGLRTNSGAALARRGTLPPSGCVREEGVDHRSLVPGQSGPDDRRVRAGPS